MMHAARRHARRRARRRAIRPAGSLLKAAFFAALFVFASAAGAQAQSTAPPNTPETNEVSTGLSLLDGEPPRYLRRRQASSQDASSQDASSQNASSPEEEKPEKKEKHQAPPKLSSIEAQMVPLDPEKERERRRRAELGPGQLAVLEAREAYQRTGDARIIRQGTRLTLPYGHVQPRIQTTRLRFTLVELAPREYVKKPFVSDPVNWSLDYGTAGGAGDFTQYIAVKPLRCGLSSNMAFTTNHGRVYNMTFVSPPCTEGGEGEEIREVFADADGKDYAIHVGFYYPDEEAARAPAPPAQAGQAPHVRTASTRTASVQARPRSEAPSPRGQEAGFGRYTFDTPRRVRGLNPPFQGASAERNASAGGGTRARMPSVSLENLSTAYEVEVDDEFPCTPASVSDDGRRMFVRFPTGSSECQQSFPLYAKGPDGALSLINYQVLDGNLYVTDGVPRRSVLVYQTKDKQYTARIKRQSSRSGR